MKTYLNHPQTDEFGLFRIRFGHDRKEFLPVPWPAVSERAREAIDTGNVEPVRGLYVRTKVVPEPRYYPLTSLLDFRNPLPYFAVEAMGRIQTAIDNTEGSKHE